jgi:hypothetical protein
MRYQKQDVVTLYIATTVKQVTMVGKKFEVRHVGPFSPTEVTKFSYLEGLGVYKDHVTGPGDYAIGLVDDLDGLVVYEWQLVPPIEDQEKQNDVIEIAG